jgi:hypothetical protein
MNALRFLANIAKLRGSLPCSGKWKKGGKCNKKK